MGTVRDVIVVLVVVLALMVVGLVGLVVALWYQLRVVMEWLEENDTALDEIGGTIHQLQQGLIDVLPESLDDDSSVGRGEVID